jgi:hypothetical protein
MIASADFMTLRAHDERDCARDEDATEWQRIWQARGQLINPPDYVNAGHQEIEGGCRASAGATSHRSAGARLERVADPAS